MRKTVVCLLAALSLPFLVIAFGCSDRSGRSTSTVRSALGEQGEGATWTCSMHPQVRRSHPGQCPTCGMDLIPIGGSAEPAKEPAKKKVKYACSMFCIPPQDKPGKCPVCGMEMVPVEEDNAGAVEESADALITLSPTAQRLAQVAVAPVERRLVEAEIRMVGKIDFDETRIGAITARVPGRLDRLFVDYTGVPVTQGDHLVYFYSPDLLTAQEELLQAFRAVNEPEQVRVAGLREAAETTIRTVREKLLLWGLTREQLDEIEKRGTPSDHVTIYAPMGGVVIEKNAVEGMYVETGSRIYTIADLSIVWVKLDAYESDLTWIRYGQHVRFETEAYPGQTFSGIIAFIDPVLDGKTRTVKLRVNVPNPDGRLKPNMFVRAVVRSMIASGGRVMDPALAGKWICPMHPEIVRDGSGACPECGMSLVTTESLGYVSSDAPNAEPPLVIPATAPLITGKRAIVFVEHPDQPGVYELRQIGLGPRAGDFYLVTDGLHEGERVVIHGNFYIDSAMQILGKNSMMSPAAGAPPPAHHHGHENDGASGGGPSHD